MSGIQKFQNNIENYENDIDVLKMKHKNLITADIAKWMKTRNINRSELSKKLKVSKAAITKLLSGDRNFTINKLVEIANALNCQLVFQLKEKNDSYKNIKIFANQYEYRTEKLTIEKKNNYSRIIQTKKIFTATSIAAYGELKRC